MNSSLYEGIQLAEGYQFTDQLTSPYHLVQGHIKCGSSAVLLSDVNGNEQGRLLDGDTEQRSQIICFSPDGSTLYYNAGHLYAEDLATGTTRQLTDIPQEPLFNQSGSFECSPDNRTLLFTQTAIPQMVRGSAPIAPYRLCRMSTEGDGFQVLYEDPPDYRLHTIACCWQRGFALLARSKQTPAKERYELWKIDLESGHLEMIGRFSDVGWKLILPPDGKQVVWASFEDGIHLLSLEEGTTRKLLASGTQPSWSPDGKMSAFMNEENCLCLLEIETGRVQSLVWFEPPNLSYKECGRGYAVQPVWSPDSRMLWFALTQTRKLRPPRNLSEVFDFVKSSVYPVLHNLNPKRTSHFGAYKHHHIRHRTGILDLCTKQVRLSMGYAYGVTWLPPLYRSRISASSTA